MSTNERSSTWTLWMDAMRIDRRDRDFMETLGQLWMHINTSTPAGKAVHE